MGIVRDISRSFTEHDDLSLAANISFFAILSLIPFLLITVSVAGFVIGSSHELFQQIVSAVTDILPKGQDELAANLNNIVYGRSKLGGIGVAFLLFIASFLFQSVEHAFNKIFHSVKKRNFFHSKLVSVLLIFGVMFVLFLPAMVNLFQSVLMKFNILVPLGDLAGNRFFLSMLMVVSFVASVMIIPTQRVQFRFALIGGVFFAVGVAIARFVFRWYIASSFDRYNLIYGSLTALIVSILWIYYLANILLLSSELVAVLQRRYSKCLTHGVNGSPA